MHTRAHAHTQVPGLEARLADSGHDEVMRMRDELEQLKARLSLSEQQLASSHEQCERLRDELQHGQAERHASSWLASEQTAEREAVITRHAERLKQGLAERVLRQWLLRSIDRPWRAWLLYTTRRKLLREHGDNNLSGDEGTGAGSRSVSKGPQLAAAPNLADIGANAMRTLTTLF